MSKSNLRHSEKSRKGIKQALKPISNASVKKIEIFHNPNKRGKEVLSEESLPYVMDEKDEILPKWVDGGKVSLIGKIMSIKGLRTSTMTVSFEEDSKKYNIDVLLSGNGELKKHAKLFQEECSITGQIERKNVYQKPKLRLISIEKFQERLEL